MPALDPTHAKASHRARRRGLFARAFDALIQGRMAHAERVIRQHQHLLHPDGDGKRSARKHSAFVIGD
jgi:hypothetical protein